MLYSPLLFEYSLLIVENSELRKARSVLTFLTLFMNQCKQVRCVG